METTKDRKITSFRLNTSLVERLKQDAKRQNRSLNNYVETLLMDATYHRKPNAETMAAIEEARRGEYAGTVDTSNLEAFIKSIEG
ncbi:toxin-antitoxin system protein [Bacteroides sp. ET71]|uniref:toxin-antitoxin system protein n=1 Tax=Bacteroides sp. ET71 TaxID=2939421 RepID=UPI002013846E|nr:toxin-antitoxin system protein [Bacteroides sp. ET71]MCL1615125.1 toxin-antitoxin system protein [Bacteroides sp. ET71]